MKWRAWIFAALVVPGLACAQDYTPIESRALDSLNFDLLGAATVEANNTWRNCSTDEVAEALGKIRPLATSPLNIKILRNLLMAPVAIRDMPPNRFFLARVRGLMAIGDTNGARSLLDMVPDALLEADIAKAYNDSRFYERDNVTVCKTAQEYMERFKGRYFEEVLNFCMVIEGKETQASVGLELLREHYPEPSLFMRAMAKEPFDMPEKFDGFGLALYEYTTGKLPENDELWMLKLQARDSMDAAKRAINLGLIEPDTLRDKLQGGEFTLASYRKFFDKAQQDGLHCLAPHLYLADLLKIEVNEPNMPHAGLIIRSLLLADRQDEAFAWYKKADFLAGRSKDAEAVTALYGPVFKLLYDYGEGPKIIISRYKNYKDRHSFNTTQTFYETELFTNLLDGKNILITDEFRPLEQAFDGVKNGTMLILALELAGKNPLKIDQVYHILKRAGYGSTGRYIAIDALMKTIAWEEGA